MTKRSRANTFVEARGGKRVLLLFVHGTDGPSNEVVCCFESAWFRGAVAHFVGTSCEGAVAKSTNTHALSIHPCEVRLAKKQM